MIETFIILTIIASLISIFGISPEHKRLRLRYNTHKFEKVLFILFFPFIALLIVPYTYISSHYDTCLWKIFNTNYEATFVIEIIIIGAGLILVISFSLLLLKRDSKIKNIRLFSNIFQNLLFEKEYISAIKLIENTLTFIDERALKISKIQSKIQEMNKAPNWIKTDLNELKNGKTLDLAKASEYVKALDNAKYSCWYRFKSSCQLLRTKFLRKRIARKEILLHQYEKNLSDTSFIEQLSTFNPYLGTNIIKSNISNTAKKEFTKMYLFYLIRNSNSILYHEINNNTSLSRSWYRYIIPEENILLNTLFKDINLSFSLGVWIPIAKYVINYIENLTEVQLRKYNSFDSNFTDSHYEELVLDEDIFKDSIYIGIKFFEIMVKEAIFQKHRYHMWLPFYDDFIKKICNVYKTPENLEDYKEFPNRFSYLIYSIISNLRDFLLSFKEFDEYKDIDSSDDFSKSKAYNIAFSSSQTLATSMHYLLNASDISPSFERDQTQIILETYFELIRIPSKFSTFLSCILRDEILNSPWKNPRTLEKLYFHLDNMDKAKFASGEYDKDKRTEFMKKIR